MTKFDDMPHMKVDPNAPLVVDDKVIPRGIDFVMKFNYALTGSDETLFEIHEALTAAE